jgi:hypothetical protein
MFRYTERSTSDYEKKKECIHSLQDYAGVSEIQMQIFEQAKETGFNGIAHGKQLNHCIHNVETTTENLSSYNTKSSLEEEEERGREGGRQLQLWQ